VLWLRSLIFTIAVPGTVTIVVPWLILKRGAGNVVPQPVRVAVGAVLIAAGAIALLACIVEFALRGRGTLAPIDPPRRFVATGLYRFTRNPMYVAVVTVLAGEALAWSSTALAGYAVLMLVVFHLFVVAWEEPALRRQFGESYVDYCRRVPRWLGRRDEPSRK